MFVSCLDKGVDSKYSMNATPRGNLERKRVTELTVAEIRQIVELEAMPPDT